MCHPCKYQVIQKLNGAPGAIPTRGLPLRRRTLYATELREHIACETSRPSFELSSISPKRPKRELQQQQRTSTFNVPAHQPTSTSTDQYFNRPAHLPTGISIDSISIDSISIDQRLIDHKPAARLLQFSSFWISASRSRIFIGPELT